MAMVPLTATRGEIGPGLEVSPVEIGPRGWYWSSSG